MASNDSNDNNNNNNNNNSNSNSNNNNKKNKSNQNGNNHRNDSKTLKTKLVLSKAWAELSPAQCTQEWEGVGGGGEGFKLDEVKIRAKGKV